jgi:hypothetical protein
MLIVICGFSLGCRSTLLHFTTWGELRLSASDQRKSELVAREKMSRCLVDGAMDAMLHCDERNQPCGRHKSQP